MKYCFILLVFAVSSLYSYGQSSRKLPASTTIAIYHYLSGEVSFGEATNRKLEDLFLRKDSLVAIFLQSGLKKPEEVQRYNDSILWLSERELKSLMNDGERKLFEEKVESARAIPFPIYKDHIEPGAEMASQFGFAIRLAGKLQLNDKQAQEILRSAKELRARMNYAKANPDSGYFEKAAFESVTLTSILTSSQYNRMLAEKNKTISENQARYIWHDLDELALTKTMNRDTAMKHLTTYYLLRNHINDAFAHDKVRQQAYAKALKMPKELLLLKEAQIGDRLKLETYRW